MTLVDACPLIALIRRWGARSSSVQHHPRRRGTPAAHHVAAIHRGHLLLGQASGWRGQEALWQMVLRDALQLAELEPRLRARCARLMDRYQDHPMDLADASLVALAEARKLPTIFSLDDHFRSYQLSDGRYLAVVP